jgi:hypothetical protein
LGSIREDANPSRLHIGLALERMVGTEASWTVMNNDLPTKNEET